ncbi:MAG: hypothetical protein DMF28_01315 [Verrucomicrobia bacterium]|nr:MAG: hypothetical protein DMF28_01315 [Verrucomicrobiota bacterium]
MIGACVTNILTTEARKPVAQHQFSLTPGFRPVFGKDGWRSRFNGFWYDMITTDRKPFETAIL